MQEYHRLYHAPVRGHGVDLLYETRRRYLSTNVEQRLAVLAGDRAPTVPLPVLTDYMAGTFLNLVRWWPEHQRPDSPEQMQAIFQRLVLPGVEAAVWHGDEGQGSL